MSNRPLPEDPMVRSLIKMAKKSQLSRRSFLAGAGGSAVALGLAACASDSELVAAEDISATDKTLNWSNWPFYIDEDDDGNYPTLDRFQEQTGIAVNYMVDYDDNNTYYAKVRDQLQLGQDIGADIVVPTEWMASRWGQMGFVQELNEANVPNKVNVVDSLANPDWDPGRKKSLPWQGGFAGLAYNVDKVGEIRTVEDLWAPELKGRVVVLSEMRDTVGILMMANGVDISSDWGANEFNKALDVLREQVEAGQIRNVRGNSYTEDLVNEDALVAIGWSGDITLINYENGYDDGEKWKFVFPESGATIWNDTMVVPIGSPRKANAEALMNYYYEPEVAAEVAAWVNYVTPVKGAYEAAMDIDPDLAENKLIFPDAATLAQAKAFRTLSSDEDNEFQAAFQAIALGA
ncbi:MAG: extracellular solute-binding protein [Microbacteriaceae bacterium]|jgi:spermidine/putrescine transport system substrate-binding protein|nr:extracellular solute-binding protein [Microbacteriaceae bacterium]MBT5247355.1 extracellular solute-binding protein [Microbacteriaceae bacterium]MBT5616420.1 extracellular solute-binding protein [Microbacteriaceae bacterium]MBT5730321.1 extracellular solute-binding protein [Microbacteriaceae bacterium]